jgi:HD-GYP domain-containing protein (c-di-GMP phosphodiesterase class II)
VTIKVETVKRVRISTARLTKGLFVSELDRPWEETPFLLQGFTIQNDEEIKVLREYCDTVFVDFPTVEEYNRYLNAASARPLENEKFKRQHQRKSKAGLERELPKAKAIVGKSSSVIKSMMDRIMLGEDFDVQTVRESVAEIVDSVLKNEDALLMLVHLRNKDEYSAEHSMRVSIISTAFGRFLGFDPDRMQELGTAAMLFDIGKSSMPQELLKKADRLTPEEFDIMKKHAEAGYELLLKKRDIPPAALDVAYSHHERMDGSGYPRGLKGHQLHEYSRIVAIVDTYDAITSERAYAPARSPLDAFRVIMNGRGDLYDEELAVKFVDWMGVYPIGSLVELNTGEVGIVLSVNRRFKLRPRVLIVTRPDKSVRGREAEKILDLAKVNTSPDGTPYAVRNTLPDGAFGIRIEQYIQRGLRLAW